MAHGLLWLAGVAGLLAGASLATHRRCERDRRACEGAPEPLARWEGEGGAVPVPMTGEQKNARQVSPEPQGAG